MNTETDKYLEYFAGSKTYNNIFRIVMIILCLFYFGLLTTLSLKNDDSGSDDGEKKYFFLKIQDKIEDLAGKIKVGEEEQVNTIKVWMIYIIMALVIFLTITNISNKMSDPKASARAFSISNIYESFTVAFIFSLTVLITSSIRGKPNYFNSLLAFVLIFCKSQIIRDMNRFSFSNLNNYLIMALFAIPTIGSIVEKVYYQKSFGEVFDTFKEDFVKNSFIAVINTVLANIVLNVMTAKKKKNNLPTMNKILTLFFQFNLYGYMFNLTTSETGNIF